MSTVCTNCGITMTPETKFCGKCGMEAATPMPASSISNPTPLAGGVSVEHQNAGAVLPAPPSLHWVIVLLLTVVTLGAFAWVWAFVQAIWVKRLTGTWKPIIWLSVPLGLLVAASIRNPDASVPASFGWLFVLGVFSTRRHVVRHYKSVEPINVKIGFWETFPGTIFYLQYHFTRIARLKREQPQLFAPYVTPVALSDEKSDGRFWLRFAGVFAAVAALLFLLIYFGGTRNGTAQVNTAKAVPAGPSTSDSPSMNTGNATTKDATDEVTLTIPADPASTETSSTSVSVSVTGKIEYLAPGRTNDSARFLMHGDGDFAALLPVTADERVSNPLTTLSESASVVTASGAVYRDANGVRYFDSGKNVTITYPNTNIGAGNPK